MTELLEKEEIEDNSRLSQSSSYQRSGEKGGALFSPREVNNILKLLLQEALHQLDNPVMDLTQRTVNDSLEMCNVDHNLTFLKGAVCNAFNSLLMLILVNELDSRRR